MEGAVVTCTRRLQLRCAFPHVLPTPRDCWTVAFGNSYNEDERCLLAGYDNGDVKLFDLRMNKARMVEGQGFGYRVLGRWRGGARAS